MKPELQYARLLRGGGDPSPLTTDGYKFSMAQAGFPLRREVFYLHYRKGGPLFIPFDFKKVVAALRPRHPNSREQGFLIAHGYGLTPAMEAALDGGLHIYAQSKGSWANPKEPVLTISGPSFLVSWLEPLVIAFQFPMQIATAILDGVREFTATCQEEAGIIHLVADTLRMQVTMEVRQDQYREGVRSRLESLRDALSGDLDRAFEVGTRSMTCMAQQRIVLEECKAACITRTSNVKLAYDLYMVPVGTTGHEHQERHGADINGFRAIRDCRPEPPSYLFDTYDPFTSGIPAAVETMLEDRTRRCSVRFDSGDQFEQLRRFKDAQEQYGLNLFYLFMDGYDDERVAAMEHKAQSYGVAPQDRHYGLGGYLVIDPAISPYSRNTVAMVYKLCETGGPGYDGKTGCRPVRKYSGSSGKVSLAGRPRVLIGATGTRYIIQEGEGFEPPEGIEWSPSRVRPTAPSVLSPATLTLNDFCTCRDLKGST